MLKSPLHKVKEPSWLPVPLRRQACSQRHGGEGARGEKGRQTSPTMAEDPQAEPR